MQTECFLCGQYGWQDKHHIFGKENRKKSEKYGLYVYLCPEKCHNGGSNSVHRNATVMLHLHQYGQEKWQAEQGKTAEDFIREFGKNYL